MYRNLLARVEAIVPIELPRHRQRLWEILQIMLTDRRQAWDLKPDGSYVQRTAGEGDLGTHQTLMNSFIQAGTLLGTGLR
jgi:polyphosphate kinase